MRGPHITRPAAAQRSCDGVGSVAGAALPRPRPQCCYIAAVTAKQALDGKALTVRGIPTQTLDEIAGRAARSGRSLQEYVRGHLIEWAMRPEPADWVARVAQRKATLGGVDLGDLTRADDEPR